jgi:proteasome lid subunit RPN8/RPN11
VTLTSEERAALREHAVREYPKESCGVILVRDGERRLMPCRNVQDDLHRRDPVKYPRDARTAYYIDPGDLLRIARLEHDGYSVAAIYHSHVDAGAYFSETDRRQAVVAGEPTYPEATYIVTSVVDGVATDMAAFRWNSERRDFVPVPVDGHPEGDS